jgi:hypothetical protein
MGRALTGREVRRELCGQPACSAGGHRHGCEQGLFLDAVERRWVEELGGMNLWFVQDDGTMITPELTDPPPATALRSKLVDLQYGRTPDPHGWMHRVHGRAPRDVR